MTTHTPPGWYDDGSGQQRWWDGNGWTEHVAPAPAPEPAAAAPVGVEPVAVEAVAAEVVAAEVAAAAPEYSPQAPAQPGSVPSADPAWAAQAAAAAAKKRNPLPWILGGAGAFVLLLIVGALVVANLLGGATKAGEPRDAILKFWDSWQSSDCEQMESVTTIGLRESTGWTTCAAFKSATAQLKVADVSVNVKQSKVNGTTATVASEERWTGDMGKETHHFRYSLEKSDGGWRIADVQQID